MAGFDINLYSNKQEFHRYSTDDFALLEIGIGAYNNSSLANFLNLNDVTLAEIKPLNPDVKEFFSNKGATEIFNKLSGKNLSSDMKIMEFDLDEKKYKEVTNFTQIKKLNPTRFKTDTFTEPSDANITDFLKSWNDIQKGIVITDPKIINGYKAVAYKIQNSLSGCITFDTTYDVLGSSRTSKIQLYLLDNADSDNSRGIALNGSPFMTDQPATPYGMKYGFADYQSSPTAVYPKPSNHGKDDPTNSVAGRMRTVYDPSTGEFESGTQQMLARLLEDIDTADVPELSVEELQTLSKEDIYDNGPDSPGYMGNFTKGKAVPLSAENGNPHMFGPDFVGGCTGDKKVQITVINRLNQSYKAGSIVVVSRMLGESGNWIIVSPGTDRGGKKKISFSNFHYNQALIPANYYFTDQFKVGNLQPHVISSKIRSQFYYNFKNSTPDVENNYEKFINLDFIATINTLASLVKDNYEDPETALMKLYEVDQQETITNIQNNRLISDDLDIGYWLTINSEEAFTYNIRPDCLKFNDKLCYIPKNVLRRSTKLYKISTPFSSHGVTDDDDLGVAEVPFWGMIFSDGYKTEQCAKYKNDVTNNIILYGGNGIAGDPNFSELPITANWAAPYTGSDIETLKLLSIDEGYSSEDLKKILSNIKKTGGVFLGENANYSDKINNINQFFYDIVNRKASTVGYSSIQSIVSTDSDYRFIALEPVNPAKMQFSPCPIEMLYSGRPASDLSNPNFSRIKNSLIKFDNQWSSQIPNSNFKDYLKHNIKTFLLYFDTSIRKGKVEDVDINNQYSFDALSYQYSFDALSYQDSFGDDNKITDRHRAPMGVLLDDPIVPIFKQFRRFPCMPILTCKTTITTNATSLLFTVDQLFGTVAKKTVSGGQGPSVTILPIGGGIGWAVGGTPIQQNSTVQWGDVNRTDAIDSFGTTALHVRIFESWPLNQTYFFSNCFTPVHLNPSVYLDGTKYELKYENDLPKMVKVLDSDNKPIIERSSVDFRLPTKKDGNIITIGASININSSGIAYELEPMNNWKWTAIRRAKLLTDGGFVYVKPVFCITDVRLKTLQGNSSGEALGGAGYKPETEFTYPDGSSFKINVDHNGKITGIKDFKSNYYPDGNLKYIIKDDSAGFINITNNSPIPTQSEPEGAGAKFEVSYILGGKLVIDRGPREVTPITRLTKSSNMGEDSVTGISTTTVNLSDEQSGTKSYDLFYFFHNDPTHYTLDNSSLFYRDLAQYVISEIKPV